MKRSLEDIAAIELFRHMPSVCFLVTVPDGTVPAGHRIMPTKTETLAFVSGVRPIKVEKAS